MKKIILTAICLILLGGALFAQGNTDKDSDPNKPFYLANSLYEKRDYEKALQEYNRVISMGIESGNLYYNMANSYFKLGKLGYAILFYEKAKQLMPQDSDLKANLDYAKSLVAGSGVDVPRKNPIVTLVKTPFVSLSLNAISVSAIIIYLVLTGLLIAGILKPGLFRKARLIYAAVVIIFIMNVGAFAIRYYDEELLRRGVVVGKNTECKYEPIDKSTTFYKLQEGDEVSILKTRDGWRRIKRIDGKAGWVRQEAVEEI
ncbi:MAG: tetratricopeptide repeat protein [Candidatus Omnitrophota bacterium]